MIKRLNVIELLSVYTTIYKTISAKPKTGRKGHYSLILLDSKSNTISIEAFSVSQFEDAERAYMKLEKKHYDDINMNSVLVSTGDLHKLKVSYPNYFMDTSKLVQYIARISIDEFV